MTRMSRIFQMAPVLSWGVTDIRDVLDCGANPRRRVGLAPPGPASRPPISVEGFVAHSVPARWSWALHIGPVAMIIDTATATATATATVTATVTATATVPAAPAFWVSIASSAMETQRRPISAVLERGRNGCNRAARASGGLPAARGACTMLVVRARRVPHTLLCSSISRASRLRHTKTYTALRPKAPFAIAVCTATHAGAGLSPRYPGTGIGNRILNADHRLCTRPL